MFILHIWNWYDDVVSTKKTRWNLSKRKLFIFLEFSDYNQSVKPEDCGSEW